MIPLLGTTSDRQITDRAKLRYWQYSVCSAARTEVVPRLDLPQCACLLCMKLS